jgi:hypothetical protein
MVANAMKINEGKAIKELTKKLERTYVIKLKVIRTNDHGDASNRTRLFIVGVHKRLGSTVSESFEWPQGTSRHVTARALAQPDDEVPQKYKRFHARPIKIGRVDDPQPGYMHKLAHLHKGMGPSAMPNAVYSWEGIWNCQTTYNGGGQRPTLSWKKGEPLTETRLTTPIECVRIASLMDSYLDFVKEVQDDDPFLYHCVNGGVPLCTAQDIYKQISKVLKLADTQKHKGIPDIYQQTADHREWTSETEEQTFRYNADGNLINDDVKCYRIYKRRCRNRPDQPKSHKHVVDRLKKMDTAKRRSICDPYKTLKCHMGQSNRFGDKYLTDTVRSMLVDTGCDLTLGNVEHNNTLKKRKSATDVSLNTASAGVSITGQYCGVLSTQIVTPDKHADAWGARGIGPMTSFELDMITVPSLDQELLSIDKYYRDQGYELFLTHPDKGGPPHMTNGKITIPFRYDYDCGGFYMDYIVGERPMLVDNDPPDLTKNKAKQARMIDKLILTNTNIYKSEGQSRENVAMKRQHCYTSKVAKTLGNRVGSNPAVVKVVKVNEITQPVVMTEQEKYAVQGIRKRQISEVYNAWHPEEREVRGVKQTLKCVKKNQTIKQFHQDHGHLGECPGCPVCKACKGTMRRIYKQVDPHKERRPGYAWAMDTITISDRSFEQMKYLLVLKDKATSYYCLIPLKTKCQSASAVGKWIARMRADPVLETMGYKMIQTIQTDIAGEWDEDCRIWNELVTDAYHIKMDYIAPERHESNGVAERACAIVEQVIKSILMENNLPPEWWSRVSSDAEFLLNRFPITSGHVTAPLDGDRARPIEIFTQGYHSRRRCNSELTY